MCKDCHNPYNPYDPFSSRYSNNSPRLDFSDPYAYGLNYIRDDNLFRRYLPSRSYRTGNNYNYNYNYINTHHRHHKRHTDHRDRHDYHYNRGHH
jgi:hypothetical protein